MSRDRENGGIHASKTSNQPAVKYLQMVADLEPGLEPTPGKRFW